MPAVYINTEQVVLFGDPTGDGVAIYLTSGEEILVAESLEEVVKTFDESETPFLKFTPVAPSELGYFDPDDVDED